MIRTYVVGPENYREDRIEVVIHVDVYAKDEDEPFDKEHAKKQAQVLKERTGAAAVVVSNGGKFWVI